MLEIEMVKFVKFWVLGMEWKRMRGLEAERLFRLVE